MRNVLLGTVFGLTGLLMSAVAWADNENNDATGELCGNNKPSCSDMGYKFSEDECKGYFMLRCPWDASKVACDCTFSYREYTSNGDIDSPWCMRLGVKYYRDPCPGVLASECSGGTTVGSVICHDTRGNDYYAGCSEEKACEVGDVLYASSGGTKKCFMGVASEHTVNENDASDVVYRSIGVVFDTSEGDGFGLAIALDENRGSVAVNESYGPCNPKGVSAVPVEELNDMRKAAGINYLYFNGVPFYQHCNCQISLANGFENCNIVSSQKGWVENLHRLYMSDVYSGSGVYASAGASGELQRAQLKTHKVMTDYGSGCQKPVIGGYTAAGRILLSTSSDSDSMYENDGGSTTLRTSDLETLFPAVSYCAEYETFGTTKADTAAAGVMPSCVGATDIVSLSGWVLPAPLDWVALNSVKDQVNMTLTGLKQNGISNATRIAEEDTTHVSDTNEIYKSYRKYWTAYLGAYGSASSDARKWMRLEGSSGEKFRQLRQPYGPVIMDFEANGSVGPVRSTEPGVRARCMIRYKDGHVN